MSFLEKTGKRVLSLAICGVVALSAVILPQSRPTAAESVLAIPGTDPLIDPTVNTDERLPEGYDQALKDGLPYGYFVLDDNSNYTFAVGCDSKGNVYYGSYTSGNITVRSRDAFGYVSLLSQERTIALGETCLFSMAFDSEDNIIYSRCFDSDGYVAKYDQKTGEITRLITGLVRPNQCAVDAQDNVYVACESGSVMKWEKSTGKQITVASGLGGLQSVTVDPRSGVIYALSYSVASDETLIGVAIRGGTLYQISPDGAVERVAGNNNQYVWRARGLCMDEDGYVYLSGEGNAWDNGNSSLIARYDPLTRAIEEVTAGMDYLTFLCYGKDGRIYTSSARDNIMFAYSEAAADKFVLQDKAGWDTVGNSRVIAYGGSYKKSAAGNLEIKVNNLTYKGTATVDADTHKVSGWINIPLDSLEGVVTEDVSGGLRGLYKMPDVTATAANGTVKTAVMALRRHKRARWPMVNLTTNALDFSEDPEAYLVYFEWTPEDLATYADTATEHDLFRNSVTVPAAGAYQSDKLADFDFSASAAATNREDATGSTTVTFGGNTATTRVGGNDLAVRFQMDDACGDWLGVSIDNRQVSALGEGVGIRLILGADGTVIARTVNAFDGKGWDTPLDEVYNGNIGFALADGSAHTLKFVNHFGNYELWIDGVSLTAAKPAGFDAAAAEFAAGAATYLTFYTQSGIGTAVLGNGAEDVVTEKMAFGAFSGTWEHDLETNTYTTTGKFTGSYYASANLAEGLEFEINSTGVNSWLYLNIGAKNSVFPDGDDFFYDFCHGKGLKLMLKDDGTAEARLVTVAGTSEGWEDAPWKTTTGNISATSKFNDGAAHTVSVSKTGGQWAVLVDGYDMLSKMDADARKILNKLMGDDTGYIVFSANGYDGKVSVHEKNAATETLSVAGLELGSNAGSWVYDADADRYVSGSYKEIYYASGDLEAGVEFYLKNTDVDGGFSFMNIGNRAAVFPAGDRSFHDFAHGTGLKVLLKSNGDAEARLMTEPEAAGWNGASYKHTVSKLSATGKFNDNAYHKVSVSKATGHWSVRVDGKELLTELTAEQEKALDTLLDGETGYIVFSANSPYKGTTYLSESGVDKEKDCREFGTKSGEWSYDKSTATYSGTNFKNTYYYHSMQDGKISLVFSTTGVTGGWTYINLGSKDAVFLDGDSTFYDYTHGTGLKLLLKNNGGVEARLTLSKGSSAFNSPTFKVTKTGVSSTGAFNDNKEHTLEIARAQGEYSLKIDGTELLGALTATQKEKLATVFGTGALYAVFSANPTGSTTKTYAGSIKVRDALAAEQETASEEAFAALALKIKVAKNFYNTTSVGTNYGQIAASYKEQLKTDGLAAVKVFENKKSTPEAVKTAYDKLSETVSAFKAGIIESCDFTDLGTMLQSANNMLKRSSVGEGAGQVDETNYRALENALAHAVAVYKKSGVKQQELDAELETLTAVVADFASAVIIDTTPVAFDWLTTADATTKIVGVDTTEIALTAPGATAYTVVNPVNLKFKVRMDPSQHCDWLGLNFSGTGMNRLAGNGVCCVFNLDYAADVRVVETVSGKGWEGALKGKQLHSGSLSSDFTDLLATFNNGEWYEFEMKRDDSGWSFTCNGKDLFANRYFGFANDMDRLLGGGNTVTMSVYTDGKPLTLEIYQDTTGAKFTFTALNELIAQAEKLLKETPANRASVTDFSRLQGAVNEAKRIVSLGAGAQFSQVSQQKMALESETEIFREAVKATFYPAIAEDRLTAFDGVTVDEENLYDALIAVDAFASLTEAQQAMVSPGAKAIYDRVAAETEALMRQKDGVTLSGEDLPYYVRIQLETYEKGSEEWNEWTEGEINPVKLFRLTAEDYLTYAPYALGDDGPFTVTVDLAAKQNGWYNIDLYYDNGESEVLVAEAADGKISFEAYYGGYVVISEVTDYDKPVTVTRTQITHFSEKVPVKRTKTVEVPRVITEQRKVPVERAAQSQVKTEVLTFNNDAEWYLLLLAGSSVILALSVIAILYMIYAMPSDRGGNRK